MAVEQVHETVVVLRNQNRHLGRMSDSANRQFRSSSFARGVNCEAKSPNDKSSSEGSNSTRIRKVLES